MSDEQQKPEPAVEPKVKIPVIKKPVVAPDGHVTLSQEDIDART